MHGGQNEFPKEREPPSDGKVNEAYEMQVNKQNYESKSLAKMNTNKDKHTI